MRTTIALLSLGLLASGGHAQSNVNTRVEWDPTLMEGKANTEWVTEDGDERALKVTNESGEPTVIRLATITSPKVQSQHYGIAGRIRYTGVSGPGFLEMMNHFPAKDGGKPPVFFSRTLSDWGMMGKLTGDSDWREFRLPFNLVNYSGMPTRLEVFLHLPGNGTVFLKSAMLSDYPNPGAIMEPAGAWWSGSLSGWIGGGAGTVFGLWGAVMGILAQAGKGRAFITTSVIVMIALGLLSLTIGIVAVSVGQPYHIWSPFVLIGLVMPAAMLGVRRNLLRQFTAEEERRMTALDAVAR